MRREWTFWVLQRRATFKKTRCREHDSAGRNRFPPHPTPHETSALRRVILQFQKYIIQVFALFARVLLQYVIAPSLLMFSTGHECFVLDYSLHLFLAGAKTTTPRQVSQDKLAKTTLIPLLTEFPETACSALLQFG